MSVFDDVETSNGELELNAETDAKGRRIAVIRTSDRNTFRTCRRRWAWSSHLRGNLGSKTLATPLWAGSGFHFAMEDYHGLCRFAHPVDALRAYYKATKKFRPDSLPEDADDSMIMLESMLNYYLKWLARRPDILPTYVVDGVPQVEVNFRIQIPVSKEDLARFGYDEVVYSGTIDRIVYDAHTGMLWVLDYKTAKMFNTEHFQNDSQVTTYVWAARHMYDLPIGGMIYAQFKKILIEGARVLKSGHLSTAQNQSTSSILYMDGILGQYGKWENAPVDVQDFYKGIFANETSRQDAFIRFDHLPRSDFMCESEGQKILLEIQDMLNPNLALYPNPTRDCTKMCPFNGACVSYDDGGHYQDELDTTFQPRPKEYDGWRKYIEWPDEMAEKLEAFNWDDEELLTEVKTGGSENG